MVRRKAETIEDTVEAEPETYTEPEAELQPYALETLSEDALSQMKIWGNSTQIAVERLAPLAPEWARFLDELFEVVKAHVQEHTA